MPGFWIKSNKVGAFADVITGSLPGDPLDSAPVESSLGFFATGGVNLGREAAAFNLLGAFDLLILMSIYKRGHY